MKTLILTFWLILLAPAVHSPIVERPYLPDEGLCVVEFNAGFNSSNSVLWIDELSDCKGRRVDIGSSPEMQKKHKIVVVPTVIIFNDGEEVERFQANIMMQLEASKKDVQDAVDEILMSSF